MLNNKLLQEKGPQLLHLVQYKLELNLKVIFVDNKTIDLKWKAGYKNLNLHFSFFDNILFVDNSKQLYVWKAIQFSQRLRTKFTCFHH